jgi:hypothetical protein
VPNHVELDRRWRPVFTPGLWFGATRKSLLMNRQPKSRLSIDDLMGFGDTQCVVVLRHPSAVIGSIGRRENRSYAVAAYRWSRSVQVADALADRDGRAAVIVDFDRLVKALKEVTQGLCQALEINDTPKMLSAPSLNRRYPEADFDRKRAGAAGHDDLDPNQWVREETLSLYQRLIAASV